LTEFLENFRVSPFKCPLSLREVFCSIQEAATQKFGDEILKTPLTLDIMFFKYICPSIIDPKKFQLTQEDVSMEASSALSTISSILNDLVLKNQDTSWGEIINMFISTNHSCLVEILNALTVKLSVSED